MNTRQFCSDKLPRQSRLQSIERVWSSKLFMDIDLDRSMPPAFAMKSSELPGISLASFSGSPAKMTRSPAQAMAAGSELVLCVAKQSHVRVLRSGRPERVYAPGAAHVWLADQRTVCEVNSRYSAMMMRIPSSFLSSASVDLDWVLDAGIDSGSGELKLFTNYADSLLTHIEQLSTEARYSVAGHLRDLAVMALRSPREPISIEARESLRVARLARIKADIQAHLDHPELSADWIAAREGISPRYLRDLLASEQTRFSDFVLQQRLDLVRRRLADPRLGAQRISTIAYEAGFGDLSYFCRVFKKHYGATPSDVRAERPGPSSE